MDLIYQGLIALAGVLFSVFIAKWKAKTIAIDTAKVELSKLKSQKWWDKKVELYEDYIVRARRLLTLNINLTPPNKEFLRSINEQELIELEKENNGKISEYSRLLREFREDLQLGIFYFNESSKHVISDCLKDLNKASLNMPENISSTQRLQEVLEREGALIHTLMEDLRRESKIDLEV